MQYNLLIYPLLKPTASLHLKMDAWDTIVSFWVSAYFQVLLLMEENPAPPGMVKTLHK